MPSRAFSSLKASADAPKIKRKLELEMNSLLIQVRGLGLLR